MMKNFKYISILVVALLSVTACNDDFLERFPLSDLTNENIWNSENDLALYTNGLYADTFSMDGNVWWDNQSDNQAPGSFNTVVAGLHNVSQGSLNWNFLRRCNFFLENYNNNPDAVPDDVEGQYVGEVLLMRAIYTADRVKSYGDIPYTTRVLNIDDEDVLYGPRVARKDVMAIVLDDLNRAVDLIPEVVDEGRISKWAANALKARICLHEGTFRKYHNLGDEAEFLNAAKDAAEAVINSGEFALHSTGNPTEDYRNLFMQQDLSGNSEAILYEKFVSDIKGHSFVRFMPGSTVTGLTKDMVNDYLCTDGLPIGLSPLSQGDNTLVDEFANRDPRMAQTILELQTGFFKEGDENEVQPRLQYATGAGSISSTGYHLVKYYNDNDQFNANNGTVDIHIIRYAEVLLIYAEVMAELGLFDQTVADATINLLRARVDVSPMDVGNLQRDPDSDMVASAGYLDADVSEAIEEIRRERRVELAGEGFRYDDLMRWRAGKFLTKRIIGAKWDAFKDLLTPAGAPIYPASANPPLDAQGHLDIYASSLPGGAVFDPNKHYLFGYPLTDLQVNPALLPQNPGW
jgi:hypothetical protein